MFGGFKITSILSCWAPRTHRKSTFDLGNETGGFSKLRSCLYLVYFEEVLIITAFASLACGQQHPPTIASDKTRLHKVLIE